MTSRRTKISPKSGHGLGHVTPTIFGSTVGYPSDSLASCKTIGHEFSIYVINHRSSNALDGSTQSDQCHPQHLA